MPVMQLDEMHLFDHSRPRCLSRFTARLMRTPPLVPDSLAPLFALFDVLVDPQVGIIHHVQEIPRYPGAPDFFQFVAQACDTKAFCDHANFAKAGGASTTRERAMAKAMGEAIERYCAAIYEKEAFPLASSAQAPFPCIPPHEFALYHPAQWTDPSFPYRPFDEQTPVRWCPVVDPLTGETWHVPACMVYLPYLFDSCEPPFTQRISTGLACHTSHQAAAITAICEVIERDAFTITWQARWPRPRIRLTSLTHEEQDLVNRFHRIGATVTLFDLTLDAHIPTVLAVSRATSQDLPALAFAASTDMSPAQAIRKSLEELAHTFRLAFQLHASRPPFLPTPHYTNVLGKDDHVHLYCNHGSAELAEWIFESHTEIDVSDMPDESTGHPEADLSRLLRRIAATGHRALLADVTTPDVQSFGLSAVRALVPGFHPLFLGHHFRALGGRRLWSIPQRYGGKGITLETGDNPHPHPYP
ncbi:MAG: hypothetical protein D6704_06115 [Nitrospirae bacterium]|nr:MAG: hypothetical protein D6704_06115 [Nitrospirota bacterium]